MQQRIIGRFLTVAVGAALALAPGLGPARAAALTGWRTITSVPSPSLLLGVTAAGPAHAWAVGWTRPAAKFVPLVEAWNGRTARWAKVSLPSGVLSGLGPVPVLDTAAGSSPSNVWAFTESGHWLRYNGTAWSAGRFASPVPEVQSSLAPASGSAWAFGGVAGVRSASTPFAALFTAGHGWKRTRVPGKGMIVAASAVSSSDIWAVTGTGALDITSTGNGLLHWSGGRWQAVASLPAALRNSSLGAVLARSDTNVWVGGAAKNTRGGTTEVVGHWNGHAWFVSLLPATASTAGFHVTSLVTDGAGGLWALGICTVSRCGATIASRLWHETAGRWTGPIRPVLAHRTAALVDLAPAAHSVWAAGDAGVGGRRPSGLIALWGAVP